MKLFYSPTSPYARKVRLLAIEKGLDTLIETVTIDTANPAPELLNANPLGKVPALWLDHGETIFDSPVICRYLDNLKQPYWIPREPTAEIEVLRWEALADGLTDAAYNLVMEQRGRPEQERSPRAMERWTTEITRTLRYIETHMATLPSGTTLAPLALAAALGYLDFRLSHLLRSERSEQYPTLLAWYDTLRESPAMRATQPS